MMFKRSEKHQSSQGYYWLARRFVWRVRCGLEWINKIIVLGRIAVLLICKHSLHIKTIFHSPEKEVYQPVKILIEDLIKNNVLCETYNCSNNPWIPTH